MAVWSQVQSPGGLLPLCRWSKLLSSICAVFVVFFSVMQDKSGIPWWLGISYKGIAMYDSNDRKTPRRVCVHFLPFESPH